MVPAEVDAQTECWDQRPVAAHKVRASDPPIAALTLVPEHAAVVVVPAADVVNGTMVADAVGDIVVPFGAADSPFDIDHGLARGPCLHIYHIL